MCSTKIRLIITLPYNIKSTDYRYLPIQIALDTSTAGYGFDLGIEAESSSNIDDEGISSYEGRLPSLIKIFWNVNDDTKKFREFFRESKGALAITEAQCITHKVRQSFYKKLR